MLVQNQATASASGRLDVMGGIADYSGSLLLQKTIQARTQVSITINNSSIIKVNSGDLKYEFDINSESIDKNEKGYSQLRTFFKKTPSNSWAAYVIGCFYVLHNEKNIPITGADIIVDSGVPIGKGVSSSAALEVATIKALQQIYNITFAESELSVLAQKVENQIVGAPCGLMDQLACYYGQQDALLPIKCQPSSTFPTIAIPDQIKFIGIDSGVQHSVAGASYADVRTAAAMGYSIIAQSMGVDKSVILQAHTNQDFSDLPFQGYLSNCPVSVFEKEFRSLLPPQITGKDFIQVYQSVIDRNTFIEENTVYDIMISTVHPIYENFRVNCFSSILEKLNLSGKASVDDLTLLGELMYQSHASYSACRLGETHTDVIVSMSKKYLNKGVFGAKITGGGSGGTVCLLVYGEQGFKAAKELHQEYQQKFSINTMWIE